MPNRRALLLISACYSMGHQSYYSPKSANLLCKSLPLYRTHKTVQNTAQELQARAAHCSHKRGTVHELKQKSHLQFSTLMGNARLSDLRNHIVQQPLVTCIQRHTADNSQYSDLSVCCSCIQRHTADKSQYSDWSICYAALQSTNV